MDVSEALHERRSVRAFTDAPVDRALLRALVIAAARAPSGGNLQPWHIDLLTGEPLARLVATMEGKLARGELEAAEYDIYPRELTELYKGRRFQVGEDMYARLGIPRTDKDARRRWFANNFRFFGAPAALFVTVDRRMGPPQWSDLGMFLQSFMLLAVAAGLATCPQECWAMFPGTVKALLGTPPERMLFCGVAVGHPCPVDPVNTLRAARAEPAEWLTEHC